MSKRCLFATLCLLTSFTAADEVRYWWRVGSGQAGVGCSTELARTLYFVGTMSNTSTTKASVYAIKAGLNKYF
jgi:hypothetical protein